MKGIDTNILIYAHRAETPEHKVALELLTDLAEGSELWAIAWPCLYEFVRVVTHLKIFSPPSKLTESLSFIKAVLSGSSIRILAHGPKHWEWMKTLLQEIDGSANLAFDVQIAAILLEHGVKSIVTADGDFRRFRSLTVINPFI